MRKFIIGFALVIVIVTGTISFAYEINEKTAHKAEFSLNIDGENKTPKDMYVIDDRTYIPLREFSDKMGYNITWNSSKVDVITKVGSYASNDWTAFKENSLDDLYGFKDKDGNIVIEPQFAFAFDFSEGMAAVQKEGGYGYINEHGDIVIQCQFDSAGDFKNGVAWVREYNIIDGFIVADAGEGANYYIDKAGNKILEVPDIYGTSEFSEGYAIATIFFSHLPPSLNHKPNIYSFINMRGDFATDKKFNGVAGGFKNGYAVVKQNDRWGVINKEFNFIIECKYSDYKELINSNEYKELYENK